ncbi:MAG: tail fiber domain-containing protein [Spirochaetota bacterium]
MKTIMSFSRKICFSALLLLATQTLYALGKTGADPGAPAGGGDFVAGNAAVAADVNRQINLLYKAFNDGANSINIDGWTNTTSNLGYTGGNIGIGIASPLAKFQVNGGSAVTLAGATGFGVFGATTGNHVAIDSTQIQAKANATTASALNLNPFGGSIITGSGNLGVATTPAVKLHVDGGSAVALTAGTGYTIIGASAGVHLALSTTQIQGKATATTASDITLNELGGGIGAGRAALAGSRLAVNGDVNLNGSNWLKWNNDTGTGINCFSGGSCNFNSSGHMDHKIGASSFHRFYASDNDIVFRVTEAGTAGFYDSAGAIQCTITAGVHNCTSDKRLKSEIRTLTGVLSKFSQIRGVSFRKKNAPGIFLGVIAQEILSVFPELVTTNEDGYLMVQHTGLFGPIIQGIKELKSEKDTQVLALEKRAAEAEQKYAALLKQVQQEKAQADARTAKLELRLARLEASLEKNRVVARR